jgi:uncharacterized protein
MTGDLAHDEEALSDVEIVARVLAAVSDLDVGAARRCLADDLVMELPYRGGGFPTTLVGDDAHTFMRRMPKLFTRLAFYDVVIHGSTPSGIIAAEYRSDGLTRTGAPYLNTYAAFFEVADGRVTRWREYFNPDVIAEAMAPAEGTRGIA